MPTKHLRTFSALLLVCTFLGAGASVAQSPSTIDTNIGPAAPPPAAVPQPALPAAAPCRMEQVEQTIIELSEKSSQLRDAQPRQATATNRDPRETELASAYQGLRKFLDSCEELRAWRPLLRPARTTPEIRAAFVDFLAALPGAGGPPLTIFGQRPLKIRIGDGEPPATPQLSTSKDALERIQKSLEQIDRTTQELSNQTARSSSFSILSTIVYVALFVGIMAVAWAFWHFLAAPLLANRVAQLVVDVMEHEGVFGSAKRLDEANRALQKIVLRTPQPAARSDPAAPPVPPPTPRHGAPILPPAPAPAPLPPFDVDGMERDIIVDWHDARKTPEEFQRKYNAFAVTPAPMSTEFMLARNDASGAEVDMWAIAIPENDLCFIVPIPTLNVSALTVGGNNRRAEEKYRYVYDVPRGPVELASLARGRRRSGTIAVERTGVLMLSDK